jgi:AraC-like DNA-binding protein
MAFRGSYCRATALIGLREIVRDSGSDILPFLDRMHIDREALRDVDQIISFRSYCGLLELLAQELPLPHLGLEITRRSPPEYPILGPMVMIANLVDDLHETLDFGLRYWALQTNGHTMQLLKNDKPGLITLRHICDPFVLPARQVHELSISILVAVARIMVGGNRCPHLVRFQHRKPDVEGPYEEIFGCPIEFGAEHSEVIFDETYLKLKTSGRLKIIRPLAHYLINLRMERMQISDRSLSTAVTLLIPTLFGSGKSNATFIAEALNMSAKTLQRQLADEGTSFSTILDDVRHKLAVQMLSQSDVPVGRIALLLDYSSSVPFTTAFRRWEGVAPLAYRKARQK